MPAPKMRCKDAKDLQARCWEVGAYRLAVCRVQVNSTVTMIQDASIIHPLHFIIFELKVGRSGKHAGVNVMDDFSSILSKYRKSHGLIGIPPNMQRIQ